MFTGLVEELGSVASFIGDRLRIRCERVLVDARIGDSIAVNGCCLTVVVLGDAWWEADVTAESRSRTSLGSLAAGAPVNLERPVSVGDRLGGHIVQGHVDGVGTVTHEAPDLAVALPTALMRYAVEKGSITIDGVSLTVVEVRDDTSEVTVAVIPHTAEVTTLGSRTPGDPVNIEADVIAKYVERLAAPHTGTQRST